MILRRISFERYGCFGSAEFEFRRGMNLISGGNETGKSLLLSALPAALLGVEHGSRLRSWGDTLNCRVILLFEGGEGRLRLTRDLENNLVKLEEGGADGGPWKELFAGKVLPAGESPDAVAYHGHLEQFFSVRGEALVRALTDPAHMDVVFAEDGSLVKGLLTSRADAAGVAAPPAAPVDDKARLQEIASLEAELAVDREDYRKGEDYLKWIRQRWQQEGRKAAVSGRNSSGKANAGRAALERQRDELQAQLHEQGLPERLPADLPALFETAEGLRQELAELQLELTPLQRRKPSILMPSVVWPLLVTLIAAAGAGAAFWQKLPWWLPLAVAGGGILLVVWSVFLVRLNRARTARDLLDQQIQAVEIRRADALSRQEELAHQFEFFGLPSSPVEMVKLQQQWRRNEGLISRYHDVCARLGEGVRTVPADGGKQPRDRHLQPEELPEAEARLAELGESLRRREARLAALLSGKAGPAAASGAVSPAPEWTEKQFLQAIGQNLERLTAGRHREVRLEEGRLRLEAAPGRWAPPSSCSRGTTETLALAIRLACARMTGNALPFPVDGLPVHLDAKRQQAVLRELERLATEQQLLLSSSDDELVRRAGRERWHVIKLRLTAADQGSVKEEADDAGQLHLL